MICCDKEEEAYPRHCTGRVGFDGGVAVDKERGAACREFDCGIPNRMVSGLVLVSNFPSDAFLIKLAYEKQEKPGKTMWMSHWKHSLSIAQSLKQPQSF